MNKDDFQVCYDVLSAKENRTEAEEKTLKKLTLIIRQIDVQEEAQEALRDIREELQTLDQQ